MGPDEEQEPVSLSAEVAQSAVSTALQFRFQAVSHQIGTSTDPAKPC